MVVCRWWTAARWVAVLVAIGGPCAAQQTLRFPAGTSLPIRFLHSITGGRDSVGSPVLAQTFAALARDSCIIVPPFTQLTGRVIRSVDGRPLGRRGELQLSFDSLEVRPGTWVGVHAVLDSLEYARHGEITDSGIARGHRGPGRGEIAVAGSIAAAVDVSVIPVALLEGLFFARSGPRASILAGEIGAVRFVSPVVVPARGGCMPVSTQPDLQAPADLPRFLPYAKNKRGTRTGDPINLIFLGNRGGLDAAFTRAGWARAHPKTLGSLAQEATAAIVSRPAVAAPVSTLYFAGREQDFTYERAGPTASIRDHVRLWLLDTLAGIWVGAATRDVGFRPEPLQGRVMHRIEPHIDDERDLITRSLEATSCADLLDYIRLPGARSTGRTLDGQRFSTDARTAVIRLQSCAAGAY
jgi:hypothetical protein